MENNTPTFGLLTKDFKTECNAYGAANNCDNRGKIFITQNQQDID